MIKSLKVLATLACLGITSSAFAIPLKVDISSDLLTGAHGSWSLSGPSTTAGGSWLVLLGSSYSSTFDIAPGNYTWSISGYGGGLGSISWALSLNGEPAFYSGSSSNNLSLEIKVIDKTRFEVTPSVSVPEPATLSLLGTGLLAVGFSMRRRRQAR